MREQRKNQRGITLIALVITIIILLILAGVTLGLVTGNNGILGRAEDASRISEIKTIEEFARLSYMDRQINEVMTGETATIAGVISDLKAKGYKIKQEAGVGNNLTGIALSENNVVLARNGEKTITYTLVYAQGETVKYFVEVQGKYYEIEFNGGNITVNTEEAKMGETSKEPDIVVESSNNSIIEAKKTEEGKILLTAKGEVGDIEITVREVNSNVTNKITATTKTVVAGVSISQTEATVKIGETTTLTATVEPSDATNQVVTWSSSDENIATVTDNGVVTGVSAGTATITVTTTDGNKTAECEVTVTKYETFISQVKENLAEHYGEKVAYTANGISDWRIFYADDENVFLIATDYLPSDKVIACNSMMTANEYSGYSVYWNTIPTVVSSKNVDKFNPMTAETMRWIDNCETNNNGKCISTLLDTNKWISFVDSKYADMAIGSPTLNMWVASWNTKYPNEKIYCNSSNQIGYYVGSSSSPNNYYIADSIMSKKFGYQLAEEANMYYPHKNSVEGGQCIALWLASPSAYGEDYVMDVLFSGGLNRTKFSSKTLCVRPVVCLKSTVNVELDENGVWKLK